MIVAAMAEAFRSHELEPPAREAILDTVGLALPDAIYRLVPAEHDNTVLSLSDAYKRAFGALRLDPQNLEPLYEGAFDAVHTLTQDGEAVLGIATGKSRRGLYHVLGAHGLLERFSTIQTADDAPSKPHPGMVCQAMDEVGAEPENTVMIGDTSYDMEMARNAGAYAIGVAWGYHRQTDLHAAGAHYVAQDYIQLLEYLLDGTPAMDGGVR